MSEAADEDALTQFPVGRPCLNCGVDLNFDATKPYTDCSCRLRYSNRVLINVRAERWEQLRLNRNFLLTFAVPKELKESSAESD